MSNDAGAELSGANCILESFFKSPYRTCCADFESTKALYIAATDTITEEVEETRTKPTFVLSSVLNLGETLDDTVDLAGSNFCLHLLNISPKYKTLTEF